MQAFNKSEFQVADINQPRKTAVDRIASVISIVFNPLLIPTLAFILMFNIRAYFTMLLTMKARLTILGIVFINTFLFPMLLLAVFKRAGIIDSFSLFRRQDRIYPLIATAILYYITYFLFQRLNIPSVYTLFMLGGAFSTVIGLIITYFYKISMHMMAIGGLTGMLLALSYRLHVDISFIISLAILIAGLTGTSRIMLKAHEPHQVYAGFFCGLIVMSGVFLLL